MITMEERRMLAEVVQIHDVFDGKGATNEGTKWQKKQTASEEGKRK
jgi:hypothetical protein